MKIKVLHITKMKGISGSENHLRSLLSGLNKDRFDIHLCILVESRHLFLLQDYKKVLEQVGVVVTPGLGYSKNGEGYIRLSLTISDAGLVKGLSRLAGWRDNRNTLRSKTI